MGLADEWRSSIHRVIEQEGTAELVRAYYDPGGDFAGALFDEHGDNNPDRFTSDDLLAASLLNVRFPPRAVRAILHEGHSLNALLAQIKTDTHLWEPAEWSSVQNASRDLWGQLRSIPGLGPTRVSKLLARKRPHLFPILDSVISSVFTPRAASTWITLGEALGDESLRDEIRNLSPAPSASGYTPSLLRVLDVALWMWGSQSRAAKAQRDALQR